MKLLRILCVVVVALGHAAFAAGSEPKRPNVVMIISDDQAWTDYGFMGHSHIATPHLDRLAAQSVVFKRGYVPSSLCCPSLASIITGQYPHQHKITSNDPPMPAGMKARDFPSSAAFQEGRERMNAFMDAVPTLPKLLVQNGYLALQTGKWWQGSFSHGGFTHGMTKGGRHGDDGLDIGRKTMQPIFDFIEEAKAQQKPFFVWYAPMLPHTPHNPPPALFEKYAKLTSSPHVARYWAMIEWFDQTCGQLLDYLDQNGLAENTVVTYLADNGWIQNPEKSQYDTRSKQSPYDGGLRTPIMVRYPAKWKPAVHETPVLSLDLFPTVLKAAGIPVPAGTHGVELGNIEQVRARKAIYGEVFTHNAVDLEKPERSLRWRWILRDGMKLLLPTTLEAGAVAELYDVVADPTETRSLASEKGDLVKTLSAALETWWPIGAQK